MRDARNFPKGNCIIICKLGGQIMMAAVESVEGPRAASGGRVMACECVARKNIICAYHALKQSGIDMEQWKMPEPEVLGCGYCGDRCEHEVGGSEESGLRYVQAQILEFGIPARENMAQDTHWTRFEPETRQPRELPVYNVVEGRKVWRSGPSGGASASTYSRSRPRAVQGKSIRSQAGALLSALKRAGMVE